MQNKVIKDKLILLNPGPVNLTPRVRNALMGPDICHREPEFSQLQENIREALIEVYGLSRQEYTSVLLTGSGTVAVESMVTSLIPLNGKLLILANGVYGERIQKMAEAHGISHTISAYQWGEELEPERIEKILIEDEKITHVVVVHHETATGRLNNLPFIGGLCKRYGKELLVDAVSSFGAEEINFYDWSISAVAASANKCLHGVPGASFVIAQRGLLNKKALDKPRSVYMDLYNYFSQQEKGSSPFTHAVQVFYAFSEALAEFKEMGGWKARKKRYEKLAALIRQRAQHLGINLYLPKGLLSCVLTALYLPENISYKELHDRLRQEGFVIYAGQEKISNVIFRIANMGTLSEEEVDRLFVALEKICKQ